MTDISADRQAWVDWPTWDLRVQERADGRALLVAAAAGIAFDAGVRSGVATVGGLLAVLVAGLGLLASGRLHSAASRACIATAIVVAGFLAVRTSVWLVPLDILVIGGLLVLAGVLARDGRVTDLPARLLASRGVVAIGHGLTSAAFLVAPVRGWIGRVRPQAWRSGAAVRGFALAAPIVLVLGALLVSADAVFASFVRVDVSLPDDLLGHVVVVAIGALGIGGVLRAASSTPVPAVPAYGRRLGVVEWTIVLGSVVALFTAFAAVQVVAVLGGAQHVLETEGLTYAEYARTGYAQLWAVTALTGCLLGALGAVAARPTSAARRRFVVLAELTILLTGVVLAVFLRRIGLYEDAYGWTMLRLVAKTGAVWIGMVLVLLAARLAGVARDRDWFVPAAIAATVTVVVALNAMNPEAVVARHNLGRVDERFDPAYLGSLDDDAVPTLVDALPTLPALEREVVLAAVCARPSPAGDGFLGWNLAQRQADDARATVCAG